MKWEGLLTQPRSCGRYVQGRNNYLRGRGDSCLLCLSLFQFSHAIHAIGAHSEDDYHVVC